MKKKQARPIDRVQVIWIVCILVFSVLSVLSVLRLLSVWPKQSFREKAVASIKRQGDWYIRNQTAAGDFYYERYAATGEIKEGNSIVRQAGALYGLGQLYQYTKDREVQKTLEKSLTYFKRLTATPSAASNAIAYEDDMLSNTTALLVLGLVEYIEADPKHETTENLEYLVKLSNYLVSTQASHSAYINDFIPAPMESDYNNGETMYALIRSYKLTRQDAYLSSVKRFADYALSFYGGKEFNSSFFSWGMAGFAHLYTVEKNERYWDFLREYADKYMSVRGSGYERYLKQADVPPVSPGSSVFLEGVSHIAWIAREKDDSLYTSLKRHVERVLDHLLVYEIGSPYGKYTSQAEIVRGAVCSQITCETTRIDFLQHNISAILLYLRFLT